MIKDYFSMAWGSLRHRQTRSWLTLVGIFIGIAAVVALISLGQGLQHAVTDEFLKLGADKLIITPVTTGFQSSAQSQNDTTLTEAGGAGVFTVRTPPDGSVPSTTGGVSSVCAVRTRGGVGVRSAEWAWIVSVCAVSAGS